MIVGGQHALVDGFLVSSLEFSSSMNCNNCIRIVRTPIRNITNKMYAATAVQVYCRIKLLNQHADKRNIFLMKGA